jgi:glycerate 2-kinase
MSVFSIWWAGLDAVRSDRLVLDNVRVEGPRLTIAHDVFDLRQIRRIAVVGAGKAGAGMAAGLEQAIGPRVASEKQLTGWLNVPADCVRPLAAIHLHAARPAGVNEPTAQGVQGSRAMLDSAGSLSADDLLIALISGGGSALAPLPIEGVTLEDKLAVTRFLSAAGANIQELNTVRKPLSAIKAGGLARACRAGRLVALIISDVLGDPLDVIASGMSVPESSSPREALAVLERFGARSAGISPRVFDGLSRTADARQPPITCKVSNHVIANNATAVNAAAANARTQGFRVESSSANQPEGAAEDVGCELAERAIALRDNGQTDCLISGGEPTVKLSPEGVRGRGGRNQQLVLAAARRLMLDGAKGITLLSGATDGEDGPTDAAGALVSSRVLAEAGRRGLDADDYLRRNDAYHWFEPLDALFKIGPTDTNVCDLRVVVINRKQA